MIVGLWHFAATSFSLLQQLYTVSYAIFNMADVNIFLLRNAILLILPEKYFETVFLSGCLTQHLAALTP